MKSPSADEPTQTAPGNSTRNGSAARAADSDPERAQRDRDARRGDRADQDAGDTGRRAATEADPIETDEDEERARRVAGHVCRPEVRLRVEDVVGEGRQHADGCS